MKHSLTVFKYIDEFLPLLQCKSVISDTISQLKLNNFDPKNERLKIKILDTIISLLQNQCLLQLRLPNLEISDRYIKTYTKSKQRYDTRYKMISFKNKLYLLSVDHMHKISMSQYTTLEQKRVITKSKPYKYRDDLIDVVGYNIDEKHGKLYLVTNTRKKESEYCYGPLQLRLMIYDLYKQKKEKEFTFRIKYCIADSYAGEVQREYIQTCKFGRAEQIIVLPLDNNIKITDQIPYNVINYWQRNYILASIQLIPREIFDIINKYYANYKGIIHIVMLTYSAVCEMNREGDYVETQSSWRMVHGIVNYNESPVETYKYDYNKMNNDPAPNLLLSQLEEKEIRNDKWPSEFEYILSFCRGSKLYLIFNKLRVAINLLFNEDNYQILYEEKQQNPIDTLDLTDEEYNRVRIEHPDLSEEHRYKFNIFDAYDINKRYVHLLKKDIENDERIELLCFDKFNCKVISLKTNLMLKYSFDGHFMEQAKQLKCNDMVYCNGYLHVDSTKGFGDNPHYRIKMSPLS